MASSVAATRIPVLMMAAFALISTQLGLGAAGGVIRFNNNSTSHVVNVMDASTRITYGNIASGNSLMVSQGGNSSNVDIFRITDINSGAVANLVVPDGFNVTFIDVENFQELVMAVGF